VDDVLLGCAFPEGATGSNIARQAALRAGCPVTVSGLTVNRFCSSGLQTIALAAQRVVANEGDVFVAGGVESISCVQNEANQHMATDPWLVQHKPEHFAVLSGDDNLVVPQIAIGMEGVISVAANCFTRPFTNMVNAALEGNYKTARALHYQLLDGIDLLFAEGNPGGVKCALSLEGIGYNHLRLPLVPVSNNTEVKIKAFLHNILK
jgi:acetyl-CoA C-acetyltransferase